MALGDYILCCKCEVKLIYDGDRGQREWWAERFGSEPEIMCPDCEKEKTFVGLTDEEVVKEIKAYWGKMIGAPLNAHCVYVRAIEQRLKEKNNVF